MRPNTEDSRFIEQYSSYPEFTPHTKPLTKLRLSHVLLLLLPGKIQAENPESGRRNNEDAQVTILICLLFVLLLMLCIAWYYLNHITEGRYHPRHLMSNLVLWWQQFWRETLAEDLDEDYQEEEQNDGELEEERQQHVEDGGGEEKDEETEEEEEAAAAPSGGRREADQGSQ
ncbi:hypothetical protein E2320_020557 [Naja naja]|nr:hypothetical protein E2320_020557 [Naja naja]